MPSNILLGTAFRTINPPQGLPLIGYPKGRPNTGVAVDLCARVLVLGNAQTKSPAAAIVVLDTLGVTPEFTQRARKAAAEQIPGLAADSVMVVATHTHSAPTLSHRQFGDGDQKQTEAYAEETLKQITAAFADAWKNPTEVAVKIARTEVRIGHCRRVVDANGVATNEWLDKEGLHSGFFNPNVRILLFEDVKTNKPRAVLSFYACHPVTGGPGNFKVSADYPGYFIRNIESALPGCFATHITGAAAQINPRDGLFDEPEKARPAAQTLSSAVLEALPHARAIETSPILTRIETLTLPLGPDARQNYSKRAQDSADGKTVTSEVQVIRLGEIAIVSSPGELFGEIGLAIENSSPFATTLVAGYTNDNLGYLCTDTARREGGYEPRNEISRHTEANLLKTSHAALVQAKNAS
jgi:hypothetical protein